MPFLVYLVLTVGFVFVLYRFVLSYSTAVMRRVVESKHRDTEFITESGLAPPEWRKKLLVRLGHAGIAKRYALARARRLIEYFAHTPLVDSEETRRVVVDELEKARQSWRQRSWDEIFPYR